MEVICATCEQPFAAKRRTATYCSTQCRVRAHRTKPAALPSIVQAAAAKKTAHGKSPPAPDADEPGSVADAVRVELEKAERVGTVMGQAALVLARRIDHSAMDTGSAVSSLVKQLSASLDAALAGAVVEEDTVDELRRRRDIKLGITG
ncbi:hypothetical protein AAFM46_10950 [Arthrobacter sp. TMP15]|uniref:hypothetical protein n=1 Tax=Arthrobacter sp. TMP15 TaxID=3140789 RepID=UPI0031BAD114